MAAALLLNVTLGAFESVEVGRSTSRFGTSDTSITSPDGAAAVADGLGAGADGLGVCCGTQAARSVNASVATAQRPRVRTRTI